MVILIYALLCLIWGSTWLAIKIGLVDAPPLFTASFRFILASAILTAIGYAKRYDYPSSIRDAVRLAHPGMYMYGISYALVYTAEQYISSALTAILFGSFPFFVALITRWRLSHEKLHRLGWAGLAIGFTGVVLISYDSKMASDELFLGSMLTLTAAFAAAWGMIIHKRYFLSANIVVAANLQMILGAVLLLLSALLFEDFGSFVVSIESVGSIIYLALIGSVTAFIGYYWLMRKLSAVAVSSIAFVTPLVAVFFGLVFGGESLSRLTVFGAILILSGLVLILRRKSNPD